MRSMLGYVKSQRAIDELAERLGPQALLADARPDLQGYFERTGKASALLWEHEKNVLGKLMPANTQNRGTCVGQGIERACRDLVFKQVDMGQLATLIMPSFEVIYSGARVTIGGGWLGYEDGASVAHAMQFIHDFGILPRGQYGRWNLSQPDEQLAVQWGEPRQGPPQEILAACRSHKVLRVHQVKTIHEMADCIAAGYPCVRGTDILFQQPQGCPTKRDKDGLCYPVASGGHCQMIRGVYLDNLERLRFVDQQSWGDCPGGPDKIFLADGRSATLPEGCYATTAEDQQHAIDRGECYAIADVQLADLTQLPVEDMG